MSGTGGIVQTGTVTPGHVVVWTTDGVVQDAGPGSGGSATQLGLTNNGGIALGINSAAPTGPYIGFGVAVNASGTVTLSAQGYNGSPAAALQFLINGIGYSIGSGLGNVTGPTISTVGNAVVFNDAMGQLIADAGAPPLLTNGGTITGDLTVSGAGTGLAVTNSISVGRNATVAGTLGVTGNAGFSGALTVSGSVGFGAGGSLAGTFSGAITLSGAVSLTASGTALTVTNAVQAASLILPGATSGTLTLAAPAAAGSGTAIAFPAASGTVLLTNGAGGALTGLTFAQMGTGSTAGDLTLTGAGTALTVANAASIGELTVTNGGALAGTFSGTHTLSGALTLSATGAALTVTNGSSFGGLIQRLGMASVTPTTGNTVAVGAGITDYRVLGGATLAALTVRLPATPANGQLVRVTSQPAVTALTVQDSAGVTSDIQTAPTALAAGAGFTAQYNTAATAWWCSVGG